MSRIGRNPIEIPDGVEVKITENLIKVKGKLGELSYKLPDGIDISIEDKTMRVTRRDDTRGQRSLHGLARALTANMVLGVSKGYEKNLEIVGVGYRCDQKQNAIMLSVGYSHRVVFIPPEGIIVKVNSPTTFSVSGISKEEVGDVAAKLRLIRPPEPYKGKGIKFAGEWIRRKAGKTAAK